MLFDYDLTVPSGMLQSAPATQRVRLTYGNLSEIRVIFPPGPATLVYVTVSDRLHQIMPANADGSLNFDDATIVSGMEYELTDSPYELILEGWSPAAIYDHVITFQFDLKPAGEEDWSEFMQHLFEERDA